MIKTKIVCTIGPASESAEMLGKLMDAGMNVARLNFSHETYESHGKRIRLIRNVSRKKNKNVAIMLDTKGPEIRTGLFEKGSISLTKGDEIRIVREDVLGNEQRFTLRCKEVFNDVKVGNLVLIDDGKMRLQIKSVEDDGFTCVAVNNGVIKNTKGVNIPDVKLTMPFLSEKDIADITFGVDEDLDLISLSFVRRKEDVLEVKELVKKLGKPNITIMSKIENKEAIFTINSEPITQAQYDKEYKTLTNTEQYNALAPEIKNDPDSYINLVVKFKVINEKHIAS